MTKAELWDLYKRKNPAIEAGTVTLSAEMFRKFFDTTYDEGFKEGGNDKDFESLLSSMGMGKRGV